MSRRFVVDASVVIKLFVDEALSDKVHVLFEKATVPDALVLFAPDLLYIECANILWKYSRRFGYASHLATRNLGDLALLLIESIPTRELCHQAYAIARASNISAYDACYLALSKEMQAPLVTADDSLIRKSVTSVPSLVSLSELTLP